MNPNVLRIDLVNSLTQREIDYLRNYVPGYCKLLYAQALPSFENMSEDELRNAIEYLTDDKIDLLDTLTTNGLKDLNEIPEYYKLSAEELRQNIIENNQRRIDSLKQTIDKLKSQESQRARRRFLETEYSDYDKNVVKRSLKDQLEQDPLKSFKPKDPFEELEDFFNKHSDFNRYPLRGYFNRFTRSLNAYEDLYFC
jgi:hypothetical protein